MFNYYTSILILSWIALVILCILIHEKERISAKDKYILDLTYALIAAAALAEWLGVCFEGRTGLPAWLLLAVKYADYILTPMSGGALVTQMRIHNRWHFVIILILGVNTVFQIIASFFGWMVRINDMNHYVYGPLYNIYITLCLIVVLLVIVQFFVYGRSFRRQNRRSLYAIMFLIVVGILMQEVYPGVRTAYISLTLGAILMFIHYEEFSNQAMDEYLEEQKIQIDTDALTGTGSRYAYSKVLKDFEFAGKLPPDLVAFTIDINGLKQVNDSLGHEAGDELICAAAQCIEHAIGQKGACFRTGGDEFIAFISADKKETSGIMDRLKKEAYAWKGNLLDELSLSAGYASAEDYPGLTAEQLVKEADFAMYTAKAEHYQKQRRDRRRNYNSRPR